MAIISSSDTQAVASNECLKLSWKVHLEIQRPNHIGLPGNLADSRRSHNLSRRLIAGPCRNANSALSRRTSVIIEHILLFSVSEQKRQIWNKDIDNERSSG